MAVLALITIPGDPNDLLKRYDEHYAMVEHVPTTGLVSHTVARIPDGLVMSDIWESADLLGAYLAQPDFQAALAKVQMPEPTVQLHDIDRRL